MTLLRKPLSFRVKLVISFLGLSLLAIAMVSTLLTLFNNRNEKQALQHKVTLYARLLQPLLSPVVAFDDQLTARETFESFSTDREVSGLGVYDSEGALIASHGEVPAKLAPHQTLKGTRGRVVALAPLVSPEGPTGMLYVSLSTVAVEESRSRNVLTAWAIGLAALLVSLVFGARISGAVTGRLARVARAAREVGEGNLSLPPVDAGSEDEIGQVTKAFNFMTAELHKLFAEKEQRAATEQARLEAEVASRTNELEESREQYRLVAETTNAIPFTYDPSRHAFTYVGPQAEKLLGVAPERWKQGDFLEAILPPDQAAAIRWRLDDAEVDGEFELEFTAKGSDGRPLQLRWVVTSGESSGRRWLRGLILDITERRALESELAQAQKLESVGRLAAGVAHEINTPIQFVNDSVHFLKEATQDLVQVISKLEAVQRSVLAGTASVEAAEEAEVEKDRADLSYLTEKVPQAFDRAIDGLERVATIVRSMKEFAHPDVTEMTTVDLNRSIQSTLVIARNEYKYVADLAVELGELPPVTCRSSDINQAVLNIVVNAAHAIEDKVRGTDQKGKITVKTRSEPGWVEISVADTGGGIPETIRHRIFDPFFTTKEVGKGTGQGLAISRSVIIDKHHGELTFQSEEGVGTTFFIRLPVPIRAAA